ncbi:MAG: hypothetical protein GX434_01610 [Peptococcaceae bacterium]|nr:hypothetical protein [Peptococcaceae bacterium]
MLTIDIPGWKVLNLSTLVFDYNGTLALDGRISVSTREYIRALAKKFTIHILTSDTFGSVAQECADLPVTIKKLESEKHTQEKAEYLKHLGTGKIVAVGNGANDKLMFETADLSIAIIGPEGCSPETLLRADIAVKKIEDAFELLFNPKRLIATLRR